MKLELRKHIRKIYKEKYCSYCTVFKKQPIKLKVFEGIFLGTRNELLKLIGDNRPHFIIVDVDGYFSLLADYKPELGNVIIEVLNKAQVDYYKQGVNNANN